MSWLNTFDRVWKNKPWFHPKNLRYFKSNLECAKQRISKGWCYRDWYNLDGWFTTVFPELLEDFVKNHHGLPNYDYSKNPPEFINWEFGEEDSKNWANRDEKEDYYNKIYEKYLLEMANHFRNAGKDFFDEKESYDVQWEEFYKYRRAELEKGLDMLKPVFFELWD